MANTIANSVLDAMNIMIEKKLGQLEFDKTLICVIESNENAEQGEYRVSDGATSFLAYSETTTYPVGQKVYVSVPNGDMGSQKLIRGKYIENESEKYYTYISPLNSFIDVTGNLVEENRNASLLANHPTRNEITLFEINGISYIGYDRIGIRGEFQSWLKELNAISGLYGIRVYITNKTETGENQQFCYTLDSTDMYGNPYSFETYYSQEIQLDISDLNEIIYMKGTFFQNEDFVDEEELIIDYQDEQGNDLPDNLFIRNPFVSLGFSTEDIQGDKVLIGSLDNLVYRPDDIDTTKNVYLRWVHPIGEQVGVIDTEEEMPNNSIIHWYRYNLNQNIEDSLAGPFWEEITSSIINKFNFEFTPILTAGVNRLKAIIETPSRISIEESLDLNNIITNNLRALKASGIEAEDDIRQLYTIYDTEEMLEKKEEILLAYFDEVDNQYILHLDNIYNAILAERANIKYYYSEILEFTNEVSPGEQAVDLITALSIECDTEGYNGIYRLYNETNEINNPTEANKQRKLRAKYTSLISASELDTAEEITWFIPVANTMIQTPAEGIEYFNGDIYKNSEESGMEGYISITRQGAEIVTNNNETGSQLVEVEQIFRIKNYYTPTAKNNTVYCFVKKNGLEYSAEATLIFSTAGSNGTEATFFLEMADNTNQSIGAITIGEEAYITPRLFDHNNEEVDISDRVITYTWFNKNKAGGIELQPVGETYTPAREAINLNGSEKLRLVTSDSFENNKFYILSATIQWTRETKLTTYFPIAIRISNVYREIEGANKIIYNSYGTEPSYYSNPYKMYKEKSLVPAENIFWSVEGPENEQDITYYPSFEEDNTGRLIVPNLFMGNLNPTGILVEENEESVWFQPLLIIMNRYASSMLNNWNGDLTLDEENGIILSAMIGAGKKESDNTFSGVLMGNVGHEIPTSDEDRKIGSEVGLYGFHHGEESYGFRADGTAFLGKAGTGRIRFDGNKGTIQSANFKQANNENTGAGMLIDLDDATLKAYGSAGSFELDMNSKDYNPLLHIKDSSDNSLMYISNKSDEDDGEASRYYLQSSNYNKEEKIGVKFDLGENTFKSYGTYGSVEMDTNNTKSIFKISSYPNDVEDLKPIMNVSKDEYFLQSLNYSQKDSAGIRFDLKKGNLNAYDFTLTARTELKDLEIVRSDDGKDRHYGGITLRSNPEKITDPFFLVETATPTVYSQVPVYNVYSSNKYYFKDKNGNFILDSSQYGSNVEYYEKDGEIYRRIDIVPSEYIYTEDGMFFYEDNDIPNLESLYEKPNWLWTFSVDNPKPDDDYYNVNNSNNAKKYDENNNNIKAIRGPEKFEGKIWMPATNYCPNQEYYRKNYNSTSLEFPLRDDDIPEDTNFFTKVDRVVDGETYRYFGMGYYYEREVQEYILDNSENIIDDRQYYIYIDEPGVTENSKYYEISLYNPKTHRAFNVEKELGTLYTKEKEAYVLDNGEDLDINKKYYQKINGNYQEIKLEEKDSILFSPDLYYYMSIDDNGIIQMIKAKEYIEDNKYYILEENNKYEYVPNLVDSNAIVYESGKYYYIEKNVWILVKKDDEYNSAKEYAIKSEGEYRKIQLIPNGSPYEKGAYYYFRIRKEYVPIGPYDLFDENKKYFLDNEGKNPIKLIIEYDGDSAPPNYGKIFEPGEYYCYYWNLKGTKYIRSLEPYNTSLNYYKPSENIVYLSDANFDNPLYSPRTMKYMEGLRGREYFYINSQSATERGFKVKNEEGYYVPPTQFTSAPFYKKIKESQQGELFRITRDAVKIKTPEWRSDNIAQGKQLGACLTFDSSGGYIHGNLPYNEKNPEMSLIGQFHLNWNINEEYPIYITNGLTKFSVDWAGHVRCNTLEVNTLNVSGQIYGDQVKEEAEKGDSSIESFSAFKPNTVALEEFTIVDANGIAHTLRAFSKDPEIVTITL